MTLITVIIHTFNESPNIEDCIDSAYNLTKQIVVIDMESKDNTRNLARNKGVDVKTFPFSFYVEPARKFGIEQVTTEWVLILDADERITMPLSEEIHTIIDNFNNSKDKTTYYRIPRKNIFARKKWLKHGGWWPDYQIRLINKNYFRNWSSRIHSTPEIEGKQGYLKNPLLHYFHGDLEKMVEKTVIYENIESQLLFEAKRSVSTLTFFRKFTGELYRRMFKKQGFLDGPVGIIESIYQAFSKTITYLYLYEKKNSRSV